MCSGLLEREDVWSTAARRSGRSDRARRRKGGGGALGSTGLAGHVASLAACYSFFPVATTCNVCVFAHEGEQTELPSDMAAWSHETPS